MEVDQLEVSSDSQLVVKQIEDSYEARENSRADALAKLATASQEDLGRLIPIEHLPQPSVSVDNGEVSPVMSEPSWMDPI